MPKGLQPLGPTRMIDRVAMTLRQVVDEIVLSANDPDAENWLDVSNAVSPTRLHDAHRNAGGLAGVEAALSLERDVLVVAWDMPFVNAHILAAVLDAARRQSADVVVPESLSPHGIEPFCAFYSVRVREPLSLFLERGGGGAHEFIARVPRAFRLPLADVRKAGDPKRLFFSVNTPEDLERARAMLNPIQ